MNKEVISDNQGISIISMFIMGSSLILATAGKAKQDLWIAIILSVLISLPVVFVHARFLVLFPGKDLYDILEYIFGKFLGKIISLLYIWFSFFLGGLVLRVFGDFISTVLPETPIIVSMIFIEILSIWVIKDGLEVLGRFGELFVKFMVSTILITSLLVIPKMDINNFYPILYKGIKPVWEGTFQSFIFPFTQIILFTTVFSSFKRRKSIYKVYFGGLLLGAISLFIISVTDIAVLGADIALSSYFPSYSTSMLINIGHIVEGIEIVIAVSFILGGFVKVSVCLLSTCNGITKIFGFMNYRFIVMCIGLLTINLSYFIHDNVMAKSTFASEIYPVYALPFQVLLPIIILIVCEIKKRRLTNN